MNSFGMRRQAPSVHNLRNRGAVPRGSIGKLVKSRVVEKAAETTARHRQQQQQQLQRSQPASSSSSSTWERPPPELERPPPELERPPPELERPPPELEVPPADICKVIDMTAKFVATCGAHFVRRILHEAEQTGNVRKFAFLEPTHVYHRYYRQQLLQQCPRR